MMTHPKDVRKQVEHAHTVDSLIAELTRLREVAGGDAPIILDYENCASGVSPLPRDGGAYMDMYWAECTWAGERYMTPEEYARENCDDYPEPPGNAIRAVFISPTN